MPLKDRQEAANKAFCARGVYSGASYDIEDLHLCLDCLEGVVTTITGHEAPTVVGLENMKELLRGTSYHFWRHAMAFVTQGPLSEEDSRLIERRLRLARRMCRKVHQVSSAASEGTHHIVALHGLLVMLSASFRQRPRRLVVSEMYVGSGSWPHNVDDFLPRGSSASVQNLLDLWQHYEMEAIYLFMAHFIGSAGALVRPVVTVGKSRTQFVNLLCGTMERHSQSRPTRVNVQHLRGPKILSDCAGLVQYMMGWQHDNERVFVGADAERFIRALESANRAPVDLPAVNLILHQIEYFSKGFGISSNIDLQGLDCHQLVRSEMFKMKTPLAMFLIHTRALRSTKRCDGPNCGRLAKDADVKLRACSGCNVSLYCARTCQQSDWRSQLLPHKRVCVLLKELQEAAPLDMRPVPEAEHQFVELCEKAGITVEKLVPILAYFMYGGRNVGTKSDQPSNPEQERRRIYSLLGLDLETGEALSP